MVHGKSRQVEEFAGRLIGLKGVQHGRLGNESRLLGLRGELTPDLVRTKPHGRVSWDIEHAIFSRCLSGHHVIGLCNLEPIYRVRSGIPATTSAS